MPQTPDKNDLRLVRFLAPAALIRQVDGVVLQGLGGYETRQEFLLDAVQNHVIEVEHGTIGETRSDSTRPARARVAVGPQAPALSGEDKPSVPVRSTNGAGPPQFSDLAPTRLTGAPDGPVVEEGLAVSENLPIFGLHNRDYPTLWAAHRLAERTTAGPIPLGEFLDSVTKEAWEFAAGLQGLEKRDKVKLAALFPKNAAKPQSAEESFRAFAIGSLNKKPRDDGSLSGSGPFYAWRLAQVLESEGVRMIGLTRAGRDLLAAMDGISLQLPHEPRYTERFLTFLREHAPADAAGFEELLRLAADEPTRLQLAAGFKEWGSGWSDTEANTNAAGFVARAREWGLLEPKLIESRYRLTEFGEARRKAVVT